MIVRSNFGGVLGEDLIASRVQGARTEMCLVVEKGRDVQQRSVDRLIK
jgi:hypothetical protein